MERLGADTMLVCSNVSPDAIGDDALAAQHLHALAERAAARGLRIAYEALAWGRHVREYQHSWEIVRAAGHPSLGVCLDSFHVLSRGSDPAGIRRCRGRRSSSSSSPTRRSWPWTCCSGPATTGASRARAASTCRASWSTCWPRVTGGPSRWRYSATRSARPSRSPRPWTRCAPCCTWRNRSGSGWSTAGQSPPGIPGALAGFGPARAAPVRAGRAVRAAPRPRPAAPPWSGLAFAEIAAAAADTPALAGTLRALGFTRAGRHRTKNAVLWRHGAAHLVLNTDPAGSAGPDELRRDPRLTALGLRTTDSAALADRAEQYLAPVLPRRRGAGEADLPSIRTPAGTTLLFCQHDDEWLGDFTAAGLGVRARAWAGSGARAGSGPGGRLRRAC